MPYVFDLLRLEIEMPLDNIGTTTKRFCHTLILSEQFLASIGLAVRDFHVPRNIVPKPLILFLECL